MKYKLVSRWVHSLAIARRDEAGKVDALHKTAVENEQRNSWWHHYLATGGCYEAGADILSNLHKVQQMLAAD